MVNYVDSDLFLMEGISKQLKITYDGGMITNSELAMEDFALTEKLTANGTFCLGECNAGYIEFSVGYGTDPLEGKDLTVTITPDGGEEFQIGIYTVVSDKPTADRRWRKITAYDALHGVINRDVIDWYDTILPASEEGEDPETVTLKEFRDSFFEEVGIEQEEVTLPNDSMAISRPAEFTQLSGLTVLNNICTINGCFGRIDRQGIFRYVFLQSPSEPLYPAMDLFPADNVYPKYAGNPTEIGLGIRYKYPLPALVYPGEDLYPAEDLYPVAYETETKSGVYLSARFEDYFITQIEAIQIRNDKNDIGITVGSGEPYIIEGNFLAYGQTAEALTTIATNILNTVKDIYFCPAELQTRGNPCLEIGDAIVLHTRYATIETYILQRKLKGIQALFDTYYAKGKKENSKKNLNSVSSQLAQTNGKINEVKADLITATKAIIDDLEANYATIAVLEANYATIGSLEVVDAKIDDLEAIAITTQNLSAQEINGNQITAGTISANKLNASSLSSSDLTVNVMTLNQTLHCKFSGGTSYGLSYIEVTDPSELIGAKVAYFYVE